MEIRVNGATGRAYTHMDKSAWGDGPWQKEPDKAQWVDDATGLDCLIVRNPLGALCGYVGVPPAHPWHRLAYNDGEWDNDDRPANKIDIHGGLTFSDSCDEEAPEGEGICHVPEPGRPGNVWWFGFDCSHSGDLAPGMEASMRETRIDREPYGRYRDLPYVAMECGALARQLAEIR